VRDSDGRCKRRDTDALPFSCSAHVHGCVLTRVSFDGCVLIKSAV